MSDIYSCMDELSEKSDEELFQIYRGYPKQRHIEERYIAARILESRDFQFKKINTYLRKWELEKWGTPSKARKLRNPFRGGQSKIISIMMLLAMIFLGTFVIIPLFFPNSIFSFSFSGDIWFFLNIFSFVVFFYIFGFIGYFSRTIRRIRKQRRVFEVFHQQTT